MPIGLDLSNGSVRGVAVDDGGNVLARAEPVAFAGNPAAAVRATLEALNAAGNGAIGVATTLPGEGLHETIAAALQDLGHAAVRVGAGSASAIAEAWCGAARGSRHVVSIGLGEHVTAGVLIDGEVLGGAHGRAGSVGWLALNPVERDDYRRYGGLEAEVSAAGIVRRLVWRVKSGDRSRVIDRVDGDLSRLTAQQIIDAAREGDGVSVSVVRDTVRYIGLAAANLAAILDPECIVLGGTLAASGDLMFEPIRLECGRRLPPSQSARLRIELSTLGLDAAALGAARAAMRAGR